MKQVISLKTVQEMKRALREDLLIERLNDSKEFWDLVIKFKRGDITREDFIADLTTETDYHEESIDSDIAMSNEIERRGGK